MCGRLPGRNGRRLGTAAAAVLALLAAASGAQAFTITLAAASPRTVFLAVGDGSFVSTINGSPATYCAAPCSYNPPIAQAPNTTPAVNPKIDVVSVSVAANAVGNGTAQAMTTNSAQAQSFFDHYGFCNLPNQLYIGGYYREPGNAGKTATVTATVPAALTDGAGDTLPFSQISWTSGGNGDAGAEPFPAGSFNGTSLTVGTIAQNQWAESCWTFSYKNTVVPAAGTYTGRVLYTISAP
ncbi:MAG TPA: hypothetical protein VMT66_15990 [Steroidobacteraceae bacterium]|nr:hypothetical protein [Steroidobacteraceae bacterium]